MRWKQCVVMVPVATASCLGNGRTDVDISKLFPCVDLSSGIREVAHCFQGLALFLGKVLPQP
jgi:hypothetical protein